MSNQDSSDEAQQIIYYQNQALSMMNIFKLQEEGFFPMWLNKLEYVADMIEVPDDKMGELFIAMLHDNVHKPIKTNNTSVNLSKTSYETIVNHYLRNYSIYCDNNLHLIRFSFRKQYVQEPIKKYANNLSKLFVRCKYTRFFEKTLCEQFLNGIREDRIRIDLKIKLSEFSNISFDELSAEAIAFETANDINYYLNSAFSMINTYNPEKEGYFYAWLNKFEYVANMIEVPNDRMIEFFDKMVDNDVHQSVRQTFPSVIFSVLSYEEIINHYFRYFAPSFESDIHRERFMWRIQYEQETIQKYANSLHKMYNKWSYTDRSEEMLCKQFVNGIWDDDIKFHLNETHYLSFDEMVAKAIAFLKCNQITHYLSQALSMMNIFKLEEKTFFPMWLNKFEYVTDTIEVPHDKMGKLFITMMHKDVNKFITKNCQFVNITELLYDQILDNYRYLFFGTQDIELYNSRFTYRNQYEQEPIETYFNNLQKLFNKCNYKKAEKSILKKQFVNGIREDDLRTHLNNTSGLSFNGMVKEAISFEKANNISHYLKPALSIINAYNPMKEGMFYVWLNKFEYVANIVKVPDNKLVKFFIGMVENNVHACVKKTYPSVNFSILSYEEIINQYFRYFYSNETDLHVKRFFCRNQYEQETIEIYADNLRKIYNKCNNLNYVEETLCEKFLSGIRDDYIRSYLSKSSSISFGEMLEKAIVLEKYIEIFYYLNQALIIINIYNPTKEGIFYEWLNKFEYIAAFIGVPNEKMVNFFIMMVENDVHTAVKQTISCVNFSELSYDEIIWYYLRYYASSDETDLHIKRLMCRNQYKFESIEKYADSLRKIYNMCHYRSGFEEILCELFVNGIRNDYLRTYLSECPRVTFDETVRKAIAMAKEIRIL